MFCKPLTVIATSFSEVVLQKAGREQCLLECLLGWIDRKTTHCLQPLDFPCFILNDCFYFYLNIFLRSNRHFPRIFTNCFCNDGGTWACHCSTEAFCRCTGKGNFSEVFLLICYLSHVLPCLINKYLFPKQFKKAALVHINNILSFFRDLPGSEGLTLRYSLSVKLWNVITIDKFGQMKQIKGVRQFGDPVIFMLCLYDTLLLASSLTAFRWEVRTNRMTSAGKDVG